MQSTTVEVLALFDRDIRYLVPIFQRNYRWNEKEHWGPLWEDVVAVAEDILDYGDGSDIVDHFLGAIVCEQVDSFGRDAHAIGLIDGQQRIVTLQLLLAATLRVCEQRNFPDEVDYLRPLVENKATVSKGRPHHRYKVFPNVADRASYAQAMQGIPGEPGPQRALAFFQRVVDKWLLEGIPDDPLDDADNTPEERIDALVSALARHILVVKIDLEAKDNAQVIFETLNARGERLTDADLIRNFLFRKAEEEGADSEKLYQTYWEPFDAPAWSRTVAHGRHQRERLHMFLNHWLSMRHSGEVQAANVFRSFKELVVNKREPAETIAKNLNYYGGVFERFESHPSDSVEWWFFRRLKEMDLITVYPVLLWLFGQENSSLPLGNRRRVLATLESFLVRRLIRRDPTRSYGQLFVEVLKTASNGTPADADIRIIELLSGRTADFDKWPTDNEIRSTILHTNVYKLKQSRLKMILEALERRTVEGGRTETFSLGNALWIEHLLPQTWRNVPAWAMPDEIVDKTKAELNRDHVLHSLGNLTLTTSKLDISMSNRPWSEKVHDLAHSSLKLNRDLRQVYPERWDEETIRDRGEKLAELFIQIWPGPKAFMTEVADRASLGEPK